MTNSKNQISLRSAALIAGISILIMAIAAPFAELYVFPKLLVRGNPAETTKNIIENDSLFRAATLGYLITFICDVLASWALYVLLKPVNKSLSLLTSWFRLIYTVIALVALTNLISILKILNTPDFITAIEPDNLNVQIQLSLKAFKNDWYFGIIFFALHLVLLGYLVLKSDYIPRILGVLLIIAGLGYLLNGIKPILLPHINTDFATFTFYGELIFMFWLLIKGSKIKTSQSE